MRFRDHFLRRMEALVGREAQTIPHGALPCDYNPAAVLLPFWPARSGVEVVFTKRPEHMPSHPGQVSFPGGRRHGADKSLEETALREAREELGINPTLIRVMGRLDDALSIAGHLVVPYVGWLEKRPDFSPDAAEVEEVIVADVEVLMRPETACLHEIHRNGILLTTHAFRWDGGYVWGLTADILLELFLWVEGKPSNRAHLRLERMQEFKDRGAGVLKI